MLKDVDLAIVDDELRAARLAGKLASSSGVGDVGIQELYPCSTSGVLHDSKLLSWRFSEGGTMKVDNVRCRVDRGY